MSNNKESFSNGEVEINKIERDVITNEVLFDISWFYLEKKVHKKVKRSELTYADMRKLYEFGFPNYSKKEINELIGLIFEYESKIPLENTYKTVGWHEINGEMCFCHYVALKNGEEQPYRYNGEQNISRKGNFDRAMRFFNRNIAMTGMIGLEVVCAVSLSSAIVGLIKSKDLKYIFHIEGTSTTGKTTSLMLATSMWSTPEISPNGVSKTWNTTDNKLINSASGNNGIMIGLDELSMINANCNQLTYLLTSGNDKLRMTDNTATEFRTIFMSTGEIQFKSTNFGGIAVRLFEVKGYNFTEDKETADKIIAFIKENYGSIGFKFARKLTKKSEKDILFRLDTITKTVIDKIRYHADKRGKCFSHLYERIAEKIAVIVLAAEICKDEMGMKFDIDAITDFMICETTLLELGQEQTVEAMEKFFEEYTKHQSKFPTSITDSSTGLWGKSVTVNGELKEVVIMYNQFVSIMNKLGYLDTNTLIKDLKSKKFIICESGKNYSRRNIGTNKKAKVIVIDVLAVKGANTDEN